MLGLNLSTIRARLLVGFVLMALLPAIGISVGSVVLGYYNGQQQALDRLESVAALKESEIAAWMDSLRNELVAPLSPEYAQDRPRIVLTLAQNHMYYDFYHKATRRHFRQYIEQTEQLQELFLLDLQGRVVLSTDMAQEGKDYSNQPFFQQGLTRPYAQPPFYPVTSDADSATEPGAPASVAGGGPTSSRVEEEDRRTMITALPVISRDGQPLGVMASRSRTGRIGEILRERTGLGRTGKSYLVSLDNDLLVESRFSTAAMDLSSEEQLDVHSMGIDATIQNHVSGSGVYDDYGGGQVVGAYRWLAELQMGLLVEQDVSEAFRAVVTTLRVNVGIALCAVFLAAGASLVITRGITAPLVGLVQTATRIAAGDLDQEARVEREDEVGVLARAFNSMTTQLRDLISNLEERVRERTSALRRRALQLETSAQVSREITSILNIDELLTRVVELIRDAFGYYHVFIFLVDKETNHLALRASSGEKRLQFQTLEIGGGSLNGEAAQRAEAVLVNDVEQHSHFLADGSLPDTRSELVVPLRVGGQVIGTMDVQSAEVNAFDPEDVLVIQSLGDQVAVAIENARLYDRSRELAVMQERNRLARELHDSMTQSLYSLVLFAGAGRKAVETGRLERVERHLVRAEQSAQQALKEMRLLVFELRPPALEEEGLAGALRQRLDAVEDRVGVETHLSVEGTVELPAFLEEGLYRIAQEALNNALKHAAATSVTVRVRADEQWVTLEVADDGVGFAPEAAGEMGRLGLASMRERAEGLSGSLSIASASGQGTQVKVTVKRKALNALRHQEAR